MISKKSFFTLLNKKGLVGLRKEISNFLNNIDVDQTVIEDLVLIINEAATNNLKHKNSNEISVNMEITAKKIKVDIKDIGERVYIDRGDACKNIDSDAMRENGRGLLIISSLTDYFSINKNFDIKFEKYLK